LVNIEDSSVALLYLLLHQCDIFELFSFFLYFIFELAAALEEIVDEAKSDYFTTCSYSQGIFLILWRCDQRNNL